MGWVGGAAAAYGQRLRLGLRERKRQGHVGVVEVVEPGRHLETAVSELAFLELDLADDALRVVGIRGPGRRGSDLERLRKSGQRRVRIVRRAWGRGQGYTVGAPRRSSRNRPGRPRTHGSRM